MDYQPGNPQGGPGGGYNPYNPYNPYGAPVFPVPVRHKGEGMATASMILGIISLVALLFLQIPIPFFLCGISIILAILSRGGAKKLLGKAKVGLTCSIAAVTLDILFCVFAVWLTFVLPNHSPKFREELNKACEQQYGVSYDEIMEEFEDIWETGTWDEDMWNDFEY
ncbi:MAG: hypothetical protein K2N43_09990 [Lachnospiraceae bacterium]|nr:hypothetical protein [Lachnospiraceae bacterium]